SKFTVVGEVITYTIEVTNTGNVTLENVVVTDTLVTLTDAMRTESMTPDGKLQVGETWKYVYTYTTTQDDMDAGFVKNLAKATNPYFNINNPPPTAQTQTPGEQKPGMTISKIADKTEFTTVGEKISYKVVITNTGNITLKNLVVKDSIVTLTNAMRTESILKDGKLQVGETWTYVYTYTTTQDDMDAGFVKNVVKATNSYFPDNDPNNPPPTAQTQTIGIQNPGMTISKRSHSTEFTTAREKIAYTVLITNTGNITLKDLVVTDSLVELTDDMRTESIIQDGKLQVGETWKYVYVYTVTQDDMDEGFVKNVVKATNPYFPDNDPNNPAPTAETETPGVRNPGMFIAKRADRDEFKEVGEEVEFTVVIKNTGNVTLKNLVVKDSLIKITEDMIHETRTSDGSLEVDEEWVIIYKYTVTAEDMIAGFVKNIAKACNADYFPDDPDNPPPFATAYVPNEPPIPAERVNININVGDCYE
ncbi:MAG: DUF11 domain-containing protein, partial [Christensenellaceae bacterium]|nr:DUF11 domain-containing protein [Christensenellaceae bacterium]